MTYVPYLIANYATGLEKRLQPWLNPDDSQAELFDGYVYRGTLSKREGYKYFAIGEQGGQPYTESRIVDHVTAEVVAVGDGTVGPYAITLTNLPLRRGTINVYETNTAQSLVDNGQGVFIGDGTGTINYLTGVGSVTFNVAIANGDDILANYDYFPDDPVMMVASFYTAVNYRELVVASTKYVNKYTPSRNVLEKVPQATALTGNNKQFFSWINYPDADDVNRLLFTNNKDVIQSYDGSAVTDYVYQMETSTTIPVAVTTLTALLMFDFKDRNVLLRTTENGVVYPRRIRISGTGVNCDNFLTSATGAGFIDIPDNTWIYGAAFSKDDLIIFTQNSTWLLKYTGNDTTPFVLNKLDESRGSQAPFAAINYLNRISAVSPRGLIITDGYRVERQDESIPDFSFNQIDGDNFELCFAGSVDADRDHYLIYPPPYNSESKRILTTNYDEDNYSIYRIPLSCMGTYVTNFNITWNDLLTFPNWDAFSDAYGNWNSFAYMSGSPFSIGGGHHGEIWSLAVAETEDNPVRIYKIEQISPEILEVTTDYNNYGLNAYDDDLGADVIHFTGVQGMEQINGKQYPLIEVVSPYKFRVKVASNLTFSTYTSGGVACRVIPFSALFKQFNPFLDQDKKVRCGWIYLYVNTTGTELTRNIDVLNATQSNPCVLTSVTNHNLKTGDQVNLFLFDGMIELNGLIAFVTVINSTSFSLDGINSTGFTAYTSGGYASTADNAKIVIEIFTNDNDKKTQVTSIATNPYQANATNLVLETGSKKWYKAFINQTGRFIQFRISNVQAGATINIQATMPGFQPVGRII